MAESTAHGAGGGRRQTSGMGPAAAARSWHHASRTGAGFTQCCPTVTFAPLHPPEPRHMQAHDLRLVPRSLWEVQVAIPALSIQLHSSSRRHCLCRGALISPGCCSWLNHLLKPSAHGCPGKSELVPGNAPPEVAHPERDAVGWHSTVQMQHFYNSCPADR